MLFVEKHMIAAILRIILIYVNMWLLKRNYVYFAEF